MNAAVKKITFNSPDEFLEFMRKRSEQAPISERIEWGDYDEYEEKVTAMLNGEEVAALHDGGSEWSEWWAVNFLGLSIEGDCTDFEDGKRKAERLLNLLEAGWSS